MKTTLLAFVLGAVAWGGPVPACTSSFQYSCAQSTFGGYYVLTPFAATGSTEITAFTTGGTQLYDVTIPSPPNGPGSAALGFETDYAKVLLLDQANPSPSDLGNCGTCLPNPGGSTIITSFIADTYIARDTPATVDVNDYQTTLVTRLNGAVISSELFGAAYGSPTLQAAILAAGNLLSSVGASAGAPSLVSNSTTLSGSQISYTETSSSSGTGVVSQTVVDTFGPSWIPTNLFTMPVPYYVAAIYIQPGQLDVSVNETAQYYIDRTVTTTNTYLVSQTYEIDGFTSTTPEPGSFVLVAAGIGILLRRRVCGRGKRG